MKKNLKDVKTLVKTLFTKSFWTSWKTTNKTVSYMVVWSMFNWNFDTVV